MHDVDESTAKRTKYDTSTEFDMNQSSAIMECNGGKEVTTTIQSCPFPKLYLQQHDGRNVMRKTSSHNTYTHISCRRNRRELI